jgi:hypothetical protein
MWLASLLALYPLVVCFQDGAREQIERGLQTLPLVRDGITETEIIELQLFAALAT